MSSYSISLCLSLRIFKLTLDFDVTFKIARGLMLSFVSAEELKKPTYFRFFQSFLGAVHCHNVISILLNFF